MKTTAAISFLLIISVSFFSCAKKQILPVRMPEATTLFEIVDKDGKSLVTSLKDSVKVIYTENGVAKSYKLLVFKLYAAYVNGVLDTTKLSTNYNGLYIEDHSMGILSGRDINPIRNFDIYLNGKNTGNIYRNYWEGVFTLNNKSVKPIATEILPIVLLQIQ
jgi:hypothetical protein